MVEFWGKMWREIKNMWRNCKWREGNLGEGEDNFQNIKEKWRNYNLGESQTTFKRLKRRNFKLEIEEGQTTLGGKCCCSGSYCDENNQGTGGHGTEMYGIGFLSYLCCGSILAASLFGKHSDWVSRYRIRKPGNLIVVSEERKKVWQLHFHQKVKVKGFKGEVSRLYYVGPCGCP